MSEGSKTTRVDFEHSSGIRIDLSNDPKKVVARMKSLTDILDRISKERPKNLLGVMTEGQGKKGRIVSEMQMSIVNELSLMMTEQDETHPLLLGCMASFACCAAAGTFLTMVNQHPGDLRFPKDVLNSLLDELQQIVKISYNKSMEHIERVKGQL